MTVRLARAALSDAGFLLHVGVDLIGYALVAFGGWLIRNDEPNGDLWTEDE